MADQATSTQGATTAASPAAPAAPAPAAPAPKAASPTVPAAAPKVAAAAPAAPKKASVPQVGDVTPRGVIAGVRRHAGGGYDISFNGADWAPAT
jgi:hypothetical protein